MRTVQVTSFGGLEVMDVVDLPDPVPGDGLKLHEVSSAGVNCADTHHRLSSDRSQRAALVPAHPKAPADENTRSAKRRPMSW